MTDEDRKVLKALAFAANTALQERDPRIHIAALRDIRRIAQESLDGLSDESEVVAPDPVTVERPITLTEPILNDEGFYVGFRVVHPPGVECVFPSDTNQCSCGKMNIGIIEQ